MTPDSQKRNDLQRQKLMRLLALSSPEMLEWAYEDFEGPRDWKFARRPETGLVMVRGRTGGGGAPFNLGEMSVTRAAVTLSSGQTGHAYVEGRNQRKAAIAAFFDALWQDESFRPRVDQQVAQRLAEALKASDVQRRRQAQATKVDFFTLVRGDD